MMMITGSRLIQLNPCFIPGQHRNIASRRGCCSLSIRSSAIVMDGEAVAKKIREEMRVEVRRMKESVGIVPGLGLIRVGNKEESIIGAREKKLACEYVGIKTFEIGLAEDSSEEEVLEYVLRFNDDPLVHGIFLQLPLPEHVDEINIASKVLAVQNDLYMQQMDGSINIEREIMGLEKYIEPPYYLEGHNLCVPSFPKGCIELLHRYNIDLHGKLVFIFTESARNLVITLLQLLKMEGAATILISKSQDLKHPATTQDLARGADIIITNVREPNLVRGSWIKPGAVIIDTGINHVEDPSTPLGYRLVGDVCFEEASKVASAIATVPAGLGPMTIPMLLSNTLSLAKRIHNFH